MQDEVIKTGLTPNYIRHWGLWEAMREVAQNMAWAGLAQGDGKHLEIEYYEDSEIGIIADEYHGMKKEHLYIGEGEQRNHEQGMGFFGEGLKMAMLVFAREKVKHHFATVGFSFWGELEKTEHGTEVLVIKVKNNTKEVGTTATVEIPKDIFNRAKRGFAPLIGIELKGDCFIPERKNEVWVRGVRVETETNPNPANVYFAYNFTSMKLTNRDRTIIDTVRLRETMRDFWFQHADYKAKVELLKAARNEEIWTNYDDVKCGPNVFAYQDYHVAEWRKAFEEVYKVPLDSLVWKSPYDTRNDIAKRSGFTVIDDLPDNWRLEFVKYGNLIKTADYVATIAPSGNVLEKPLSDHEKEILYKAIEGVKYVFDISLKVDVEGFPEVEVVESFDPGDSITGNNQIIGNYNRKKNKITIIRETLQTLPDCFKILFHEAVHWVTDQDESSPDFNRVYEEALAYYVARHYMA